MEYQVTPEQGKELVEKLQAVALNIELKAQLDSLLEGCRYSFSDDLCCGRKVGQAFHRMVKREEYNEESIKHKFRELFPHAYLYFSSYDFSIYNSRYKDNRYVGNINFRPLTQDLEDIINKERNRKLLESKFSKAILLGVNVFLDEEQSKILQNCLYPINHEWVVGHVEELKKLPTYSEDQLIEILDGIGEKVEAPKVVPEEVVAVRPIPSSKKKGIFEKLFGG